MELKKSPKADLQNKRPLFLQIGLAIALLAVIGMFSWSQKEKKFEKMDLQREVTEMDMVEVTREPEKKPEAPKTIQAVSDIINVIDNKVKIDNNTNMFDTEFTEDFAVPEIGDTEEEGVTEDIPFVKVEKMPQFQGKDVGAFRVWIMERLKYPAVAAENGIQGKVILSFVVERDGSLGQIKVLASPDKLLSEEALRVLKLAPKWTPGEQQGKKVRVTINVPIDFRLQNS